jgi:hypothetical protein
MEDKGGKAWSSKRKTIESKISQSRDEKKNHKTKMPWAGETGEAPQGSRRTLRGELRGLPKDTLPKLERNAGVKGGSLSTTIEGAENDEGSAGLERQAGVQGCDSVSWDAAGCEEGGALAVGGVQSIRKEPLGSSGETVTGGIGSDGFKLRSKASSSTRKSRFGATIDLLP